MRAKKTQISTNKHERLQELVFGSQEGGATRSLQAREDGVSRSQRKSEAIINMMGTRILEVKEERMGLGFFCVPQTALDD